MRRSGVGGRSGRDGSFPADGASHLRAALPELAVTLARDNDFASNLPWFTIPYCVWTLFGCLALGWLFGGGEQERRRQAA